jgi:hypothetical protein
MKKKAYLFPLLLVLMLFSMTLVAMAATKEEDLYYNDSKQSFVVWISYEKNDVKITLIDPDGKKIDPLAEDGKTDTFVSDTSMYITVPDAKEGQWKIQYDKGSNSSLEVKVQKYENPIWITALKLDGVAKDKLQVTFQADHDEDLTYTYKLYLTTDDTGQEGREIASGTATANESVKVEADLSDVNTYDNYYIRLYVYYEKDGLEYFDDAYTEAFSYENTNAVEGLTDYDVQVNYTSQTVTYNWENYAGYDVAGAWVTVEADGTQVYDQYIDADTAKGTTVALEDGVTKVTSHISVQYSSGRISDTTDKEINWVKGQDEFYLSVPESGLLNTEILNYSYANADNQEILITQNGEEETVTLNGSGQKQLTLVEGDNVLTITYTDEANVTYVYALTYSVDKIAPEITLFENYDGAYTDADSVILIGQTDSDAALTIQGESVELKDDGTFSKEVALESGVNTITLQAQDEAGNVCTYAVVMNRRAGNAILGDVETDSNVWNLILTWLPMILAAVASIIGIVFLLICMSVKKKKAGFRKSLRKFLVFFSVLAGLGGIGSGVVWFLRHQYENSKKFIDLTYYYAQDAYNYMKWTNVLFWTAMGCVIALAVCIWLLFVTRANKKPRTPKPPKQPKPTPINTTTQSNVQPQANAQPQANVQPQYKFCKNCGTKMDQNAAFCPNCGTKN